MDFTEVYVWGSDSQGQLGMGTDQPHKTHVVPRLCSFNILLKQVSCGENHAALLSASGHVYTMGSNYMGKLGIANT